MKENSRAILATAIAVTTAIGLLLVLGWWFLGELTTFRLTIPPAHPAAEQNPAEDPAIASDPRPFIIPSPPPLAPMPKPLSLDGLAPADAPAAAAHVSDALQRQLDALANDDDLLDEGEKARRFVMALCRDLQGRIWVGCEDSGVWCYDSSLPKDQQWKQFTRKNTGGPAEPNGATIESGAWLGDENGYALACDKLGRIWVGHLNHGVSVYNGKSWRNYGVLDGPLGERIFAIKTCPTDGDVWIATSAGLTRYSLAKDTWSYYTRAEGLPSDQASAIAFDPQGNIILGTQCDGLALAQAKDDYKTWRQVTCAKEYEDLVPLAPKGHGLPTNLINDVLVAKDGTIYVATTAGLAWSTDQAQTFDFIRGKEWAEKVNGLLGGAPKDWQPSGTADLHEDHLTKLAEDDSGNISIGGWHHGYAVYDPKNRVIHKDAIGSAAERSFTTAILAGSSMPLVVGSYGNGLAQIQLSPSQLSPQQMVAASAVPFPTPMAAPAQAELQAMLNMLSKVPALAVDSAPRVVILNSDWITRGDWLGRYGRYWVCMAASMSPEDFVWGTGAANVQYEARIGPNHRPGDSLRYWVHRVYTTNRGSLELPTPYLHNRVVKGLTTWEVDRRQSEWDDHSEAYPSTVDGPHVYCDLSVPPGIYFLSLYNTNKDGHNNQERFRDYRISIRENALGPPGSHSDFALRQELATGRIRDFWSGTYTRFLVRGPIRLTIEENRSYSHCTILAAMMLDDATKEFPEPYYTAYESPPERSSLRSDSDDTAGRLWDTLIKLQRDNPIWYNVQCRPLHTALARWYRAELARREPKSKGLFVQRLATTYYALGLYANWELLLENQGIVTSRGIEKALRWDGRYQTSADECHDLVSEFRRNNIAIGIKENINDSK